MKTNQAVEGLVAAVMLGLAANAPAMPSKQEINKAQPLVAELMAPAMDDYKAKKKTAAEVADAAVAFAAKAETEATKFMLYRSSIPYYVRGEAYDKAAEAVTLLRANVKDVPAEVIAEIISKATVRANREKAPRLFALYQQARTQATAEKDVKELRKKPATLSNKRKLAEALATTGDWPEALKVFADLRNDAAQMAKKEQDGSGKSYELGEFWWAYEPIYENAEDTFKVHAATHYRKALAADEITGLKKEIVERRVKEYEGAMEIACGSATSSSVRGLYCVIDLSGGPDAKKYPVSYLNAMPKGGWSDEYKTEKLVLRRVDPGKPVLVGKGAERRRTSVSEPYYLGVFEVTQGQWELMTGTRPSFWRGKEYRLRPVDSVTYQLIRGKNKGSKYPESNDVDEDSFLGVLRAKTGLTLDLPTGNQWEYACAAGTETDYNNGGTCTDNTKNAAMDAVGRYMHNGGWDDKMFGNRKRWSNEMWVPEVRESETKYGTAAVGSYVPNKWGFYDMHGNVWECCLEWADDGGRKNRTLVRGGWWLDQASQCCTWQINKCDPSSSYKFMTGLRLCLPLSGCAATSVSASSVPVAKVGSAWQEKGNTATLDLGKGEKIEFVKCPPGEFKMLTDYAKYETVDVKMTRPFWISKTHLSKGQYQAAMNHAVDAATRTQRQDMSRDGEQKAGMFEKMNFDYRAVLPSGYVIRYPSIAEWEYAYHANTQDSKDPYWHTRTFQNASFDILRPKDENVGSTVANKWGITDFRAHNILMDRFEAKECEISGGNFGKILKPQQGADPFYWTDSEDYICQEIGISFERRNIFSKKNEWTTWKRNFHLVVGPDLVSEWKAKHGEKK